MTKPIVSPRLLGTTGKQGARVVSQRLKSPQITEITNT